MGSIKAPRSLGLTFKREGRFIRVAGYIDEFADYAALQTIKPPLKLILRDVVSINSQGLRKWALFIRNYGLKSIEFYECPALFIDTLNMIPDIVSPNNNMKRIKSVFVPHVCPSCRSSENVLVETADVRVQGDECDLMEYKCRRCATVLQPGVDPSDHFLFLFCD